MKRFICLCLGLLLVLNTVISQENEKKIEYNDCLYAFLQGTGQTISDSLATQYMIINDYKNYQKYHKDEFEWDDKLSACKKNLIDSVSSYNPNTNYFIATGIEFDKYDFDKLGFSVIIKDGQFFPLKPDNWFNTSIKNIGLGVKDFSNYNFIAMDKDVAKKFLNSRKTSSGNIDRKITIIIHFTLMSFSNKEYSSITVNIDKNIYFPLVAVVKTIEVFDKTTKIGELTITN